MKAIIIENVNKEIKLKYSLAPVYWKGVKVEVFTDSSWSSLAIYHSISTVFENQINVI